MGLLNTKSMFFPQSFQEFMAALLTLLLWIFAMVVYSQNGDLPDWLIGLVTFSWGVWLKSPSEIAKI